MAYIRLEYPKVQVITDTGIPAIGWKIYTYLAGTTDTDIKTYSDRALSSENTNPVITNSRGECDIYTDQSIKLVLKTDADVLVWSQDYVGEMLSTFYTGSSSGTTDNVYDVTVSPIPAAYTANMTVIFTPDVDNIETTDPDKFAFTGTGPNDVMIRGPYTGSTSSTFKVEIDGVGTPNTFKWRKDSEAWTSTVDITGDWQTLKEGMEVKFSTLTGHTSGDYWTQGVDPPCKIDVASIGEKLVYKNSGGSMELLDGSDIIADYPATIVYSDIQDCWILNNPSTQAGGSSSSSTSSGTRQRFEKTDNYTLNVNDAGNLIDFSIDTSKTLTLDAASLYNGMFFYVRAGGDGDVVITADGSETIAGPQYPDGNTSYTLLGGTGSTVQLQCNGVSWEILTVASQDIALSGSSRKLVITVTSNTALTLTADEIILKSDTGDSCILSSVSLNIAITTSGANGLDTGSEASSTWYAVYVIWNRTTVAGLLSTNATTPTLPTGYTYYARVGWIRNDGSSNLLRTIQKDKHVQYVSSQTMGSGATGNIVAPTYTAVAIGNFVPTTAVKIHVAVGFSYTDTASEVVVAPNNGYGTRSTCYYYAYPSQGYVDVLNMLLESTNIYWINTSTGSNVFDLRCAGWEDS